MKDNREEVESGSEVIEGSVSSKMENSEIPICPQCSRNFPSLKSLYGHLRSHPNKGYRGSIRPRINFKPKRKIAKGVTPVTSAWGTKARRGRTELELMIEAAEILMSLFTSSRTKVSEPAKTYQCSTCNKAFTTHQALGGHIASHNKIKNVSEAESLVEHKCKICKMSFATGQALGGHMRRHFTDFSSNAIGLDLNKAPQQSEEEEMV